MEEGLSLRCGWRLCFCRDQTFSFSHLQVILLAKTEVSSRTSRGIHSKGRMHSRNFVTNGLDVVEKTKSGIPIGGQYLSPQAPRRQMYPHRGKHECALPGQLDLSGICPRCPVGSVAEFSPLVSWAPRSRRPGQHRQRARPIPSSASVLSTLARSP